MESERETEEWAQVAFLSENETYQLKNDREMIKESLLVLRIYSDSIIVPLREEGENQRRIDEKTEFEGTVRKYQNDWSSQGRAMSDWALSLLT